MKIKIWAKEFSPSLRYEKQPILKQSFLCNFQIAKTYLRWVLLTGQHARYIFAEHLPAFDFGNTSDMLITTVVFQLGWLNERLSNLGSPIDFQPLR